MGRYDYMAHPSFNPPTCDCPDCPEPSKTFFIGAKTVSEKDGSRVKITRWKCEHKHEWETREKQ